MGSLIEALTFPPAISTRVTEDEASPLVASPEEIRWVTTAIPPTDETETAKGYGATGTVAWVFPVALSRMRTCPRAKSGTTTLVPSVLSATSVGFAPTSRRRRTDPAVVSTSATVPAPYSATITLPVPDQASPLGSPLSFTARSDVPALASRTTSSPAVESETTRSAESLE